MEYYNPLIPNDKGIVTKSYPVITELGNKTMKWELKYFNRLLFNQPLLPHLSHIVLSVPSRLNV